MGTAAGSDDVTLGWVVIPDGDSSVDLDTSLLEEGFQFFVSVECINHAGNGVVTSTPGLVVDFSPPTPGVVEDGSETMDIDYQANTELFIARWRWFSDQSSTIVRCVATPRTR